MITRIFTLCYFVISAVALVTYAPAQSLGFYGDDYSFIETAGRMPLAQYLANYFDPRVQTGWYRPLHGIYFGVGYVLFGGMPLGYHLVQLLIHVANCLILFAILVRVTKGWRVALLAVLIYAGLPLYGVAVFWPGDVDFLLTFFYLLALLLWIIYLQERRLRFYIGSSLCFVLALMTKEFGVTLPLVLFLLDLLVLREPVDWRTRLQQYAPFLAIWLVYLPMEFVIQSRSVLTNQYGYGIGTHAILNFLQYLTVLAFPWGLPPPFDYLWLAVALSLLASLIITKRNPALIFIPVASVLAFVPVILFPWFFARYLYMSAMGFAILIALLFDHALRTRRLRRFTPGFALAIALVVLGNGLGVADAAADFADFARASRVPFRDISQRHSSFPDDTYLYFIYPRTPTSELSGMFFLRYGTRVSVASNGNPPRRAQLRDHQNALVIYFDEEQRTRELAVDRESIVKETWAASAKSDAPIRLEGYELARANLKRDQAIVLLLYWRGLRRMDGDYIVSVKLMDQQNSVIERYAKPPRRGDAPTSQWIPNELVVDAIQIPISPRTSLGSYRLEIGMMDPITNQLIGIEDVSGGIISGIRLEPVSISE